MAVNLNTHVVFARSLTASRNKRGACWDQVGTSQSQPNRGLFWIEVKLKQRKQVFALVFGSIWDLISDIFLPSWVWELIPGDRGGKLWNHSKDLRGFSHRPHLVRLDQTLGNFPPFLPYVWAGVNTDIEPAKNNRPEMTRGGGLSPRNEAPAMDKKTKQKTQESCKWRS